MTLTKLQKNSDRQWPYVYLDKLLIAEAFRWKKGQLLGIAYDIDNRCIVISKKGKDRRKLQRTSSGFPFIYFDKLVIETSFGWEKGQPLEIEYDASNKRVVVTEPNGAEVKDVSKSQL